MPLFFKKREKAPAQESRDVSVATSVDESTVSDVLLSALLAGETISREKAMNIPAVASAVDLISSSVASMPVRLFKYKDGHVEEVTKDDRVAMLNGDTRDTLDMVSPDRRALRRTSLTVDSSTDAPSDTTCLSCAGDFSLFLNKGIKHHLII